MTDDTIEIRLGGKIYRAPRLTISQWRKLWARLNAFSAIENPSPQAQGEENFEVAKLVLGRLEPPIADFDELECSPVELFAARDAIFEFSGFTEGKAAANGV